MDFLRSAHRVPAVVSADGQTSTKIRWYKCKPGAKAFPGFHAFGSAIWEPHPDEWTEGPGVKSFPLEWRPAGIRAPAGTEFHGQQEWYEKGIPREVLDDPEPHKRPPCIPAPIPFGVRVGLGVRRAETLLPITCGPNTIPPTVYRVPLYVHFSEYSGAFLTHPELRPVSPAVVELTYVAPHWVSGVVITDNWRIGIQGICGGLNTGQTILEVSLTSEWESFAPAYSTLYGDWYYWFPDSNNKRYYVRRGYGASYVILDGEEEVMMYSGFTPSGFGSMKVTLSSAETLS